MIWGAWTLVTAGILSCDTEGVQDSLFITRMNLRKDLTDKDELVQRLIISVGHCFVWGCTPLEGVGLLNGTLVVTRAGVVRQLFLACV